MARTKSPISLHLPKAQAALAPTFAAFINNLGPGVFMLLIKGVGGGVG
jgi:hypothetical protein